MKYLDCNVKDLNAIGGNHTAREIALQPDLWVKTYAKVLEERDRVEAFMDEINHLKNANIILTGAGTSAFIGEVLEGIFQRKSGIPCRAIPTTDIITHPENYFLPHCTTVMVSFARSGDSPESVTALELARIHCKKVYELTITCNKEGKLAKRSGEDNGMILLLPEESNDSSLVMTGSFSSMLLAGLLILNIKEIQQLGNLVDKISEMGRYIIREYLEGLKEIAAADFERVVFLGSGPLFGLAKESHLKIQELTNGRVVGKFDSFLGLRHGPQVIVDEKTILVFFLSNKEYSLQYELDLIRTLKAGSIEKKSISVGNGYDRSEFKFDLEIHFPDEIQTIPEDFLALFYIIPSQMLGFFKALNLGISPDAPSTSGSINRVVQGVKIYDLNQLSIGLNH